MVFNFLKKHKRLNTSQNLQEADGSPHSGQYKRRRSPVGRDVTSTRGDVHALLDDSVVAGGGDGVGGPLEEDENGVLKFTEWNEESSVITLQLGNSTPSQQTGGSNLTSDTLKRLRRQSSQQALNKWIKGRDVYQSTQSIAAGGSSIYSNKKSSRPEERQGGLVSASRSIPSLLLPALYNSKLDESLEGGDSNGDIYETVQQGGPCRMYSGSRPSRPPSLKPIDFYGSRTDLYQSNTELYTSRSELYSPNKNNGSDIYGSKSEFVFPSQHHHHHNHRNGGGGGGYYSTANNGPSSRPNSIYSPSGTLTRLGSKVSGCSIKTAGGQTPTAGGCCEESGNFYESDSGVSSLYEPLSFCGGVGGSLLIHSTSQHRLDFLAAGGSLHGHQHLPQAAGDFNRSDSSLKLDSVGNRLDHLRSTQAGHDHLIGHHHHHHDHQRSDSKTSSLQSTGSSRMSSDSGQSSGHSGQSSGHSGQLCGHSGQSSGRQEINTKSVSFQAHDIENKDYDDVNAAINEVFDSIDIAEEGGAESPPYEGIARYHQDGGEITADMQKMRKNAPNSGRKSPLNNSCGPRPRGVSVQYSSTIASADAKKQPSRKYKSFSESRRASNACKSSFTNGLVLSNGHGNVYEGKRYSLLEDSLIYSSHDTEHQYSEVSKPVQASKPAPEELGLKNLVARLQLPVYLELLLCASETTFDKLITYIQDVMPELTENHSSHTKLQDSRSFLTVLGTNPSDQHLAELMAKQLADKIDLLRCRLSALESEWNENNLTFSDLQSRVFSLVNPEQMRQISNYRKDLDSSTRLLHLLSSRVARCDQQLIHLNKMAESKMADKDANQLQKLLFEREQERLQELKLSTLERLAEAKHLKAYANTRRQRIKQLLGDTVLAEGYLVKFDEFCDKLVDVVFTQEEVKTMIKTFERQRSSLRILFHSVPVSIL